MAPLLDRRLSRPPIPRYGELRRSPSANRRSIGLLGGSFNPAHSGHRHLSLVALRQLALDEIWWIVSPQNPLKSPKGMAPFAERVDRAEQVANHPQIRITDIESRIGTVFSVDTLKRLTTWHNTDFVFLMGADNLTQLPEWRSWRQLVLTVPIAVFHRSPYSRRAMNSQAAHALVNYQLPSSRAAELKGLKAPVWTFVHMQPNPASSTAIRQQHLDWWI